MMFVVFHPKLLVTVGDVLPGTKALLPLPHCANPPEVELVEQ